MTFERREDRNLLRTTPPCPASDSDKVPATDHTALLSNLPAARGRITLFLAYTSFRSKASVRAGQREPLGAKNKCYRESNTLKAEWRTESRAHLACRTRGRLGRCS